MRAEGGSPNLINGVSRQAPEVRLPSQLQESVNQFPTVTRNLVPRNPAILKGRVAGAPAANTAYHLIDRDTTERYVVRMSPSGVVVHDLAGTAKTVNAPNGNGYLSGISSASDYEALTVADHTFIVNKKKVVAQAAATSAALEKSALLHVAAGEYHTKYRIVLNGVEVASYLTNGGPGTDDLDVRQSERQATPASIAYGLANGTPLTPWRGSAPGNSELGDSIIAGGLQTLSPAVWSVALYDNVIYLKNLSGADFTISCEAEGRDTAFRAHKGFVKDFSELPRKAPVGFTLKVAGSDDTDYDDYWVQFQQGATDGLGRWKECVGAGEKLGMDRATMPHVLVRESNGTFTFRQGDWADRAVGDSTTNDWPSFVGSTINGFAFAHNRLGILSGENVVFSRVGEFFNFFRETILTGLDTDPIDQAISYDDVSTAYHAVSLAGELIIFTQSIPFRMKGGDIFSQKTASFVPTLSNRSSSKARPVPCGNKLFFVNDTDSGAFVHEFVNVQDETIQEAPSINEHCHGYVPTGVFMMDGDEDLKLLAMVSSADPTTIYTYKWLWIGQNKAQSAWQKWVMPASVKAIKFIGEELVAVLSDGTYVEHLGINCHEAWTDGKPAILLLDRRVTLTGVYSAGTDQTTYTTPYPAAGAIAVLNTGTDFGTQPTVVSSAGTSLVVSGNYGGLSAYVGFPYQAYGVMSPFVVREKQRDGTSGNAVPGVELKVASMRFDTGPSVGLDVTLTRSYRPTFVHRLSAAIVGTKTSTLGSLIVGKLTKALSIMAAAEDVTIRFENSGPYPYSVLSYKWTGGAYPKGY
ncbi:lipocalin/fatty-acid binding family protein [Mesorhizobium sp. M7A.F.Ca.MR.362.00.0.0]|uniref:phage nozzle protein n=1 Tax=Mesorhizobium sp. M7A.F.Ca.MR.362.00.0.0 TaxID=2496779 RepID=UPI000FD47A09|nr:lipocalin/fatty-acid binding family protein [Mesorhizobium sp. M7A.F.Ca.MR.362.00.0.0]RUU76437.1 lipocalin/fatty-acid binding family protein [Mesorhizobium sp. M7A.F.Ca.MR.362.00.0.0]RWN95129.1 MAG: lipocalin/fatty-acid binding family protein [Mesorhizobium sp.]